MTPGRSFGHTFSGWPPSVRVGYFTGPREPNGCRNWTGKTTRDGYALFALNGNREARVSRFILGLTKGDPRVAMHICDNPRCVEPSHLKAGTHADNVWDKIAKGRQPGVDPHCCRNGHAWTPGNTYTREIGGGRRPQKTCRTCNAAAQRRRMAAKRVPK